jgi:hypothetical protein
MAPSAPALAALRKVAKERGRRARLIGSGRGKSKPYEASIDFECLLHVTFNAILSSFARPDSRGRLSLHELPLPLHECHYFPANSRFTASLTIFPSTRMPAALKRAMAFFMTVPMSFMVGVPISATTAFTPATTSASPAALGR